ncbi:MAG: ornithine carbamoyltransferase [Burkholderiales bacterium]
MSGPRHFLQFKDFTHDEFMYLFDRTRALKAKRGRGELHQPLHGKMLAMIFEKTSTRTRVSFEAGIKQLGGSAIFLTSQETHREPIEDVAKVISRMVDIVMIRTFGQDIVERFAAYSKVPVINGLTDQHHPCQILADVFTYIENRGPLRGRTVAWIGDCNNVCNSWAQAASLFDFILQVATPKGYESKSATNAHVKCFAEPQQAVRGADLVITDVWTSMGHENEAEERKVRFAGFQVDESLLKLANRDALFMHCLPAHRGEEVAANVIDGPRSVVWEEAENRLHTQKALMEYLLLGKIR